MSPLQLRGKAHNERGSLAHVSPHLLVRKMQKGVSGIHAVAAVLSMAAHELQRASGMVIATALQEPACARVLFIFLYS